jgi:L-ascorbate metabolism protein UlaG (beta-lactamase superfamily)
MNLTYYGHSCFSVDIKGKTLLFDPFISPNELASHIDISKIPDMESSTERWAIMP